MIMKIDNILLDKLTAQAKESPRLRMNLDLRNSPADSSQRMLNAIEPGTLIPIHRHCLTSETVAILRGRAVQWLYDAEGNVTEKVLLEVASEDKDAVVRPLANALVQHGLRVWYDEFELKIGDSLRRKIDKGLANSRFGIVVLSRDFIKKGWTNYELDGIISKAVSGEQVMLPIWHEITKQEIIAYSPSLADKVARNTSSYTIDEIANEIAELIRSK